MLIDCSSCVSNSYLFPSLVKIKQFNERENKRRIKPFTSIRNQPDELSSPSTLLLPCHPTLLCPSKLVQLLASPREREQKKHQTFTELISSLYKTINCYCRIAPGNNQDCSRQQAGLLLITTRTAPGNYWESQFGTSPGNNQDYSWQLSGLIPKTVQMNLYL